MYQEIQETDSKINLDDIVEIFKQQAGGRKEEKQDIVYNEDKAITQAIIFVYIRNKLKKEIRGEHLLSIESYY